MAMPQATNSLVVKMPLLMSITKLLSLVFTSLPFSHAAPTRLEASAIWAVEDENVAQPDNPSLWIYLAVAVALVLLGGAFAGLTIALMGQDEIYLQVIRTSGEGSEKKHAAKVLRLLERGKHWVLVTLLLGNVITNETLPIVLDRSLGGGWPAVLGSTVLIVIFGEIIPQSICVRYGLPIGAWMSTLVLALMYILAPVAWPTAKLLDRLLGEDHGTTYKKAGLKTLVTLHKTLGSAGEQLNADEVTIISAVLDLKEKSVGSIMTPMDDVFTMSSDTVLDEKTMEVILSAGYSRIPIYEPTNKQNFVGMLLVKVLITYDPEDCKRVSDFALATLPETKPETSCLDIVNFFQEGKSHMVLVSESPAEPQGALGVVTLEDVIEELIGEEIIDESDVFVDVHKAIRRLTPAPKTRIPKGQVKKGDVVVDPDSNVGEMQEGLTKANSGDEDVATDARRASAAESLPESKARGMNPEYGSSPKTTFIMRRTSSAAGTSDRETVAKRGTAPDLREHLKHLGPSNVASRPRQTRYNTVKIKPGGGTLTDGIAKKTDDAPAQRLTTASTAPQSGFGDGLLSSAGKDAKDGVQAVQAGYGTLDHTSPPRSPKKAITSKSDRSSPDAVRRGDLHRTDSGRDTLGSLQKGYINGSRSPQRSTSKRGGARSGSITENIMDVGGIQKVVLETTSSSESSEDHANHGGDDDNGVKVDGKENEESKPTDGQKSGKKKRRRKRKKAGQNGEEAPLLETHDE